MYVAIGILVALLLIGYFMYAGIIRKRNGVQEAYSGIDVQLTKRHDLIPNVLATAQKFMTHEKGLMEDITKLRTAAMQVAHGKDIPAAVKTENELSNKLGQLMIAVENYPTLKSDTTMLNVQEALEDVEEHIAASRRFYNSATRVLNDTVQVWPMSMVAGWIGVKAYPYFEADKDAKEVPNVAKMFA